MSTHDSQTENTTETYILAGGCFWCQDAIYRRTKGIIDSECGYIGGPIEHPTYEQVCSGTTGHAEAVKVTFDPQVIPADVVLDIFFASHDPTSLNKQGADVGPQYRSAVFPANTAQREKFQEAINRHQKLWDRPIVTSIEPKSTWWPAEEVHQDFYSNHPWAGYCQVVINPKLNRIRHDYGKWLEG